MGLLNHEFIVNYGNFSLKINAVDAPAVGPVLCKLELLELDLVSSESFVTVDSEA